MKHIDTVKREQQRKLERKTITTKSLKYSIFLKSFHFETSFFWPHCTAHRIPNEGLNPHLQQWQLKCRVLTTGLPGKSLGLNVLIPHVRIVYEICCYLWCKTDPIIIKTISLRLPKLSQPQPLPWNGSEPDRMSLLQLQCLPVTAHRWPPPPAKIASTWKAGPTLTIPGPGA